MILKRGLSFLSLSFYDLDDINGIICGLHYLCLYMSERLVRVA